MKFKLLPIILSAMMMVGCAQANNAPSTKPDEPPAVEPTEPVEEKLVQVISFTETAGTGEHDAESLMVFMEGDLVDSIENVSKIYKSTGSSGAHPNQDGIIKTGTAKVNGTMTLKLKEKVTKLKIQCHDFYAKSADYPENTNFIIVNDVKLMAPYNETGAAEELVWEFEETDEIRFEASRVYLWGMTIEQ